MELPASTSAISLSSHVPGALGWKGGMATNVKPGTQLVEKIQPHFVLQPPEEQTDNWDDDFEGGISFTKLQGKLGSIRVMAGFLTPAFYFSPGKAFRGG